MNMRKLISVSTGLTLAALVGCAPNVDSVDRTQPNAINKRQFEGIWYTRSMVVEADPEAPAVEGITSNMEKVRWDITEDLLIAYRSYEFVPYAEGLTDEGRDFFGAPVAAYEIEKHFDIQREYNAATGVENNVIVENDTDRPWFEREYMRVNWSTNLVGQPTTFWTGWSQYPDAFFSGTSLAGFYVQGHEETNPDRPIFTEDYFDVTNYYKIAPSSYYCNMMLLFNQVPRCGAANVKVRVSFRKVDPTEDYEPLYYPDVVELKDDSGNAVVLNFDGRPCGDTYDPGSCSVRTYPYDAQFGNFRILRTAFDQERYLTNTGRIYMAGRFDLWRDSYNDDGSEIPYEQREPQPVIYYGNVGFPDDMVDPAKGLAEDWDKPFAETVAYLKGYRDSEGNPDIRRLKEQDLGGQDMFQFRQNDCNKDNIVAYAQENDARDGVEVQLMPVINRVAGSEDQIHAGNVAEVCAAVQYAELQAGRTVDPAVAERSDREMAFTWQRKGDLRYNFQNYIEQVQTGGPWGVAQFGQDPETGEFVGSNIANYFGAAGDSISQRHVDIIQWLNGDLDEEELFRGDIARQTVVSRRQVKNNAIRQVAKDALMAHDRQLIDGAGDSLVRETTPTADEDRFARMFAGTDIEKEILVNEEILRGMAGPRLYQPSGSVAPVGGVGGEGGLLDLTPGEVSDEALAAASPVNWGMTSQSNPFMKAALELGRRAFDMADFFDPNSSGIAEFYKGEPRDVIWQDLRHSLYEAIQSHEVGHTVGLRHNFNASMDALNYRPEFWYEERTDGPALQRWTEQVSPENPTRRNEYKYASIMDYGFDVPLNGLHGIGSYDEAAIRFMYGQIVEVWDSDKIAVPDPRKYGSFARRCGHDDDFWGLPMLFRFMAPEDIPRFLSQDGRPQAPCAGNYDENESCDSELDQLFREVVVRMESYASRNNLVTECALLFSDLNWLMGEVKKINPSPEGEVPAAANVYDARTFTTVDAIISQQLEVLTNQPEYDDPNTPDVDESQDGVDTDGDGAVDDKGYDWASYLFPVEYGYCSDIYAGFSNPACKRWDTGWDFEESAQYSINRFDRDYIFNHFRRDSLAPWTSPWAYMARLEARRLIPITQMYRYYLFTRRSAFEADLYEDWAEAAFRGINFLERILQAPEPGTYCLDQANNRYVPKTTPDQQCPNEFEVGLGYGGGRYLGSAWTDEYFYKTNRIGNFYDKLSAIRLMTSSTGFFARSFDDLFNRRAFSLGYLRTYTDPLIQRFASLIEGDHEGYRPRVVMDEEGNPDFVRYMPLFDESLDNGDSVRQWLLQYPEIEPAWSYSLRYYALAYAIGNWSSINDYSPEFYRFTKIAIEGTPEDVEYPDDQEVVEFTDPETLITYRAPVIEPVTLINSLRPEFPVYYGDPIHRTRGEFRDWGVGANLLVDANDHLTNVYQPAQAGCDDGTGVGPIGQGNQWETQDEACQAFTRAQQQLAEKVGFIDIIRKFNRRAELPN